ncbi:MAG: ABC transporter substrate-binding protein [Halanaerobiales bacterium]|nr:ABC transporter substrate-binding protein [Halanaerobiales bacterium]
MKKDLQVLASIFLVLVLVLVVGGVSAAESNPTVLRTTATATPETVDPARGSGENDNMIFVNVYESLVTPNQDNGFPEPFIATEWTVSDDGRSWVFKLREDVVFSDGNPLTAADVKYSMERMIEIGEGYAFIFKDIVNKVKVIDNYKVEFVLKIPFGPFLSTLDCFKIVNKKLLEANTLSEGRFGANGDYGTGYLLTNSAGSGPYVVTEFKIRQSVQLEKNANYWREIPAQAPDQVLITQVREPSTTKMLIANGDVDMVHGHQTKETLQALLKNEGIIHGNASEFGLNYFMINTKKPPTDDVHIRKAISYATNYELMNEIFGGMPKAQGPVPPTLWGASSNFDNYYYNPEKAKAAIAQSKYADTLKDYPLDLAYIQGNGDTDKLAMVLAHDLQAVGFSVKINEVPWVLFCNNQKVIETSPHITNAFCTANYLEAGSILEFKYASWTTGNWNQNEWLLDDKFDTMILEALGTIDADARKQKYEDIQKYLVNEVVPSVYTFVSVLKPVWNSDVFSWRIGQGKPHPIVEYNYYYADFAMK